MNYVREWSPLPLRLGLGITLMLSGGIKLFGSGGHENISHLIAQLGLPQPELLGWVIGGIEFIGGAGVLLGAFLPLAAALNALNAGALLLLGMIQGETPLPLPGGDPFPRLGEMILILGATLSLLLSGPGRCSVDLLFGRYKTWLNRN